MANTVQTYEVCDDLNDGDDANGQTEIILTDFNNEVLNGQDADYTKSNYFHTPLKDQIWERFFIT